jgi:flagellar hook-associated protein 1 FlgK
MAGLFDSLSIATSALTAYNAGLDTVGQNIANINTPGYSRRTVAFAERPPADTLSAGRGVDIVAIQAYRDTLLEARTGHEQAGLSHDSALVGGLSQVEAAIGLPGSSLDADLDAFFTSFSQLSTDVTSTSARDSVVRQGQQLAQGFNALSNRLGELQRSTDVSIRDTVTQLNAVAAQIAQLNGEIANGGPGVETLKDQRSTLLQQIQGLADVAVL